MSPEDIRQLLGWDPHGPVAEEVTQPMIPALTTPLPPPRPRFAPVLLRPCYVCAKETGSPLRPRLCPTCAEAVARWRK